MGDSAVTPGQYNPAKLHETMQSAGSGERTLRATLDDWLTEHNGYRSHTEYTISLDSLCRLMSKLVAAALASSPSPTQPGDTASKGFVGWRKGFVHVLEQGEDFDLECAYNAGWAAALAESRSPTQGPDERDQLDTQRYGKEVSGENMNGLLMKYFVLKPNGIDIYAQASRRAMRTYAALIESENAQFAKELREWADKEFVAAVNAGMHNIPPEGLVPEDRWGR